MRLIRAAVVRLVLLVLIGALAACGGGGTSLDDDAGVASAAVGEVPVWPAGAVLTIIPHETSLELFWPQAVPGAPVYKVYRDGLGDGSDSPHIANPDINASPFTFVSSPLSPCTSYSFRIELWYVNAAGSTVNSGAVLTGTAYTGPSTTTAAWAPRLPEQAVDFPTANSWLYTKPATGEQPIQTGLQPGYPVASKVAIITGKVSSDTAPLGCVKITVDGHPEYGQSSSISTGDYWIAVDGGKTYSITLSQAGYQPVHRQAEVRNWSFAPVDRAILTRQGPTAGTFGGVPVTYGGGAALLFGGSSTDADGTRKPAIFFPSGTHAQVAGEATPRSGFQVRMTEYTVGPDGRDRMPAPLPPTTMYTYALALELVGAEGKSVSFDHPFSFLVDNFLGVTTPGEHIPVGYYDVTKQAWVAEDDGRMIRIAAVSGSSVTIEPADVVLSSEEQAQIAAAVTSGAWSVGKKLWRVTLSHFTDVDLNFGLGLGSGAVRPEKPNPAFEQTDDPHCTSGSIIECENQSLGERIPIAGTPYSLHYSSRRASPHRILDVPYVPPPTLPASGAIFLGRKIVVHQNGVKLPYLGTFDETDTSQTRAVARFLARPDDSWSRKYTGPSEFIIQTGYDWLLVPSKTGGGGFGHCPCTSGVLFDASLSASRNRVTLWSPPVVMHEVIWSDTVTGFGGWTLDVEHRLDPSGYNLFLGDGRTRKARPLDALVIDSPNAGAHQPLAGVVPADNGWVLGARLETDGLMTAFGPAGQVVPHYFCPGLDSELVASTADPVHDTANHMDFARAPDGSFVGTCRSGIVVRFRPNSPDWSTITRTRIGGSISATTFTNGAAATSVRLGVLEGVAVAKDGTIYVVDRTFGGIRSIDTSGRIWNVPGYSAGYPRRVAVRADGTLYVSSYASVSATTGVIDSIDPNTGVVTRVAGGGTSAAEGAAAEAAVLSPVGIAVTTHGDVIVADRDRHRIRIVSSGIVRTIAGTGVAASEDSSAIIANGDGGDALNSNLNTPLALALLDDRSFLIGQEHGRLRRVRSSTSGSIDEQRIPSEDGSLIYVFDNAGFHTKTINALTGVTELLFGRTNGYLTSITDAFTNKTTIARDATNPCVPTSIQAPFGQATTLDVAGLNCGSLNRVTAPNGDRFVMEYAGGIDGGLLSKLWDPRQNQPTDKAGRPHEFTYTLDAVDLLVADREPGWDLSPPQSGFKTLARFDYDNGWGVDVTTALGRVTRHLKYWSKDEDSRIPGPNVGIKKSYRQTWAPSGASSWSAELEAGLGRDSYSQAPNGAWSYSHSDPGPRFGQNAPIVSSVSTTPYPGATPLVATHTQVVDPPKNFDPSTLNSVEDTTTIGALSWKTRYDKALKKTTTTTPLGRQTIAVHDANGLTTSVQVSPLATVYFQYDAQGRPTVTQSGSACPMSGANPDFVTAIPAGADCRRTTASYVTSGASKGYLQNVLDAGGRYTSFLRDAWGRSTTTTLPGSRTIGFHYDADGNLDQLTPPGTGGTHYFDPDIVGQPKKYRPPAIGGTLHTDTDYAFNIDGQPTSVNDGRPITFAWDNSSTGIATGFLESISYADGKVASKYDDTDRLKRVFAANNDTIEFTYKGSLVDSMKASVAVPSGGDHKLVTQLAYDSLYRVGTITPTLTSTTVGGTSATSSPGSLVVSYDDDGLLKSVGQLTLTRPTARSDGRVTQAQVGNIVSTYTYNSHGEVEGTLDANDDITVAGYDVKFGTTSLFKVGYRRDQLGRIINLTEQVSGGTPKKTRYTYWPSGFLQTVETRTGTGAGAYSTVASYTYDANGNRKTGPGCSPTCVYDEQDRLTSDGTATYEYDNSGTLKKKTQGTSVTLYDYDALGQLKSVTMPDGHVVQYRYDAQGRRTGRKDGTQPWTVWVYSAGVAPLAQTDELGSSVDWYVYGTRVDVPDYIRQGATTYRVVRDLLGSPRLYVETTTGAVAQAVTYSDDAFGTLSESATAGSFRPPPFGFAGGVHDRTTSIVHFGDRDYSPGIGRWLTKDPMGFDGRDTNLYGYVSGQPVDLIDTSGMAADPADDVMDSARYGGLNLVGFGTAAWGLRDRADGILKMGRDDTFNQGLAQYRTGICEIGQGALDIFNSANVVQGAVLASVAVSRAVIFRSAGAIQKGFQKHGHDVGLEGNWNPRRAADFSRAVNMHMNSPDVVAITGTYRGNIPVTHYYNPATGVNLMVWGCPVGC